MTLSDYIAETGETEAEIARRAAVSQATVNRIRNGVGNHTVEVLMRVAHATGGRVTPNDFAGLTPISPLSQQTMEGDAA